MAVVGLDWNINTVTLNAANNYQAVAPLTVYFDSNYAGQFTVVVSSGSLTPITLTLTGNGTDTYVADFLVRAEDWFTSANNTDTSISLELSSEGWVGGSGLGVYLEDVDPECTSLSFVSDWSDPTVFIQYITSVTATATFDLKFGATIEDAYVRVYLTGSSIPRINLSQSGDVWTGTRNAAIFSAWGVGDIRLEATDSRGKVCTFNNFSGNPITVYKNGAPTLNIDAFRSDSNGDFDLGGGYIAVTAYATPYPPEVMPAISTVEVTLLDENMGVLVPTQTVANGTQIVLGSGSLSPTSAYNVRVRASNAYSGGTKTKTVLLNPVNRIINVKVGGKAVAFGKVAETDELVDSEWSIRSAGQIWSERATGDGRYAAIVAKSQTNAAIAAYNDTNANYIELVDGSSGNRGLYTDNGWVLYLGTDGEIHFGKPVNAANLPVASATEAGIVSTGAQTLAGAKNFLERPTMGGSIRYPGIIFASVNGSQIGELVGLEYIDTGSATFGQMGDACWSVEVHGNDGDGGISPYRERYLLPFVTVGRTNSANYNILTSKSAVTIAQGGTGATNAATARSNLGLGSSANLLSGTLTTTEVTLTGAAQYSALVVYGKPSGGAFSSVTIPMSSIGTGGDTWQLADNSSYRSFNVKKSGNNIIIKAVAGSGSITGVRGII